MKEKNGAIIKLLRIQGLSKGYRFGGTVSGTPGVEIATHKGASKNKAKMV